MKIPLKLILLLLCINCSAAMAGSFFPPDKRDSVVIPFEYKQSALYQLFTMKAIDSVINILLKNEGVTLTIEGYAHQDEGNDTITKYLSLNRALFVKTYVLGRGIDSSRIESVIAYGKTRQLYRGTMNMGLGNCRAVIKLNYPPPKKLASDRDGDNLEDSLDMCPDEFGYKFNGGCPDTSAIIVPFELKQTSLHSLTFKVLDSVVNVLRKNPTYTLAIEGHAYDTEGNDKLIDNLSKERAEMVKGYLTSRYISAARIESITYAGASRPITAGRNSREIMRNCRAEITIYRN